MGCQCLSWKKGFECVGKEGEKEGGGDTLVGRKVPMTSEVFWVSCGPPGGGGGTTRGPAIVSALAQKYNVSIANLSYPWSKFMRS